MKALVFGGSRGIGAAIVAHLARDNAEVIYTYTKTPGAQNASNIHAISADIAHPDQVIAAFEQARGIFGTAPDTIIMNAGINVPPAPLADFDPDNFRRLVEINIVGAFNVLSAAAREVADGGTITALTTSLVRHAVPGVGPYSATKAAVEALIRSMAKELSPRGVRVNGVAPGPVDTDLFRSGKDAAAVARSAAMSPLNRIGTPDEIAEVVGFLASNNASWIQGQIIQPNGGLV
ncbi:SDR family oxidoreductase [Lentibacter algarum]|uniref:SDR family oxidoreductase n=1 Tax=Lentibacter algarum TaxID=576131 RepID=UPI001C070186|nr:SDR family oxidoreductase [Lentibacter algarum]MBU2980199.1 SDR family oxidoreductase [Lentibacter algarum]